MTKDIHFGTTQSGKQLYIDQDIRKTHMHVIGASGRGKSYFLEYLIRQDIRNGDGLCLIDPHGTLYHNIVAWCSEHSGLVNWDKLILLDASAPGWSFGFNPLNFAGADTSYSVDSMVNACAQVWGGEDTSSTPLLKRVLRGIFHALVEKKLTLLESHYLINERDDFKPLRKIITGDLSDSLMQEQWDKWNDLSARDLKAEFSSSTNRLDEFIKAPVIRSIIGQNSHVIDFRKVMDEGAIVLVNLQARGQLSDFNARTLGTLITNDLFLKANDRPEGSRPFYFYIDECGRYLNESIQRILDESRKRGLHLVLANQHLAQLRAAGETVYSAVMTDAQTKVIFGGLQIEDAEQMVKEVFLDLDLEEPKESLTRRVAVGQESIVLHSGSSGGSSATSSSHSYGSSDGYSTGVSQGMSVSGSETTLPGDIEGSTTAAWGLVDSQSSGESHTTSEVMTESQSESATEMSGWAEAFKSIYDDVDGGHFSLEEQRYKKASWLKKQPQQMALLAQPDFSLIPFRVATLRKPRVTEKSTNAFIQKRFEALPFVQEEQQVLEHLKSRERELKIQAFGDPIVAEELDPWDNG